VQGVVPARSGLASVIVVVLCGASVLACLPRVSFECQGDGECSRFGDGRCDAGNCIYPDDTCLFGERYSRYADPSLANSCVAAETVSGDTDASGTTFASTSMGEGSTAGPDTAAWWDCGWRQRARVAFAGEEGPALVDFTVLVAIDHGALGGTFAPDGADIRFVDDDGTTVLDHEIERLDPSGLSFAWVRVPELRTGSDDGIHLYWDNPDATAREAAAVWDEHHVGVWHLGGDVRDSTATGAHGSDDSLGAAVGRVGDGRELAIGMGTSINVGSAAALDDAFVSGGTVLAWVRVDALPDGEVARVVSKTLSDPGHSGWKLFVIGDPIEPGASSMTFGFHREFDGNPSQWQGPTDAIAIDDTFRLIGATFCDDLADCRMACADDCSGDDCFAGEDPVPRLFLDGEPVLTLVTREVGGMPVSDAADQAIMGRGPAGGEAFAGVIDEVRISRTVRCDAWMRAEHLSMIGALAEVRVPQTSTCP
jgi:hypothetical protein